MPEDDKLAKELIFNLNNNNTDFLLSKIDKKSLGKNPEDVLSKLYKYFDHDRPEKIEIIGSNIFSSPNKRRSILTYQIKFPNSWYAVNVVIDTIGNEKKVVVFRIKKIPDSLEKINSFNFKNKTLKHYVVLMFVVLIPLFMLYALVLCVKSDVGRKWLWIVFILFGVGRFGINWTTGQFLFNPLSLHIQLFGVAFFRGSSYAPWILSISFPLGAVLFLIKRKKLMMTNNGNQVKSFSEDGSTDSDASGARSE